MTPDEAKACGDIQVGLDQGQWLVILTALHRAEVGLLEAIGLSMLAPWVFSESSLTTWMKLYDDQPDFSGLLPCQVQCCDLKWRVKKRQLSTVDADNSSQGPWLYKYINNCFVYVGQSTCFSELWHLPSIVLLSKQTPHCLGRYPMVLPPCSGHAGNVILLLCQQKSKWSPFLHFGVLLL